MMYKPVMLFLVIISLAPFDSDAALAKDIAKGTWSIGASSTAIFSWHDIDDEDNTGDNNSSSYNLSLEFGYFSWKNFEAGTAIMLHYHDNDDVQGYSYFFSPYITYHLPLNSKSNIYTTIGGGYGRAKYSFNDQDDNNVTEKSVYAELGYEYFFSDNVAFNLGILGEQVYSDVSEKVGSDSINQLATRLRLKLYF